MEGYLMLILHAHLPFVRHPEYERFLEENWLFEAITECYVPLLQIMEGWSSLKMEWRMTMTLSPTLCAMFQDQLLIQRYRKYLDSLIELSQKEIHRTMLEPDFNKLARFYYTRFLQIRNSYESYNCDLVRAFASFQKSGNLQIITTAATHALLPLLAKSPQSIRAQIMVARDDYIRCFGIEPTGFWLPECAYSPEIEPILKEAGFKWFVVDTHGLMNANPPPKYAVFAPAYTPEGLVVFGRDSTSAHQVWSRDCGYPGDPRYRDFYRDIGYDLEYDYIKPYLPGDGLRSFTGIKYYRITGKTDNKLPYNRDAAIAAAADHSRHFYESRIEQINKVAQIIKRQPVIVCPYDAELFGHWWYEGPEFLNYLMRYICFERRKCRLTTPDEYLADHREHQTVAPCPSSWGEEGHFKLWINQSNAWILPHLNVAQIRMKRLAEQFTNPPPLVDRALKQAARELLLAQASDWPFIIYTKTSPGYARKRVTDHIVRFTKLFEQIQNENIDEQYLERLEKTDTVFPLIKWQYWR
jgi:1,4-alpha-glucan branching enzyme